MEKLNLQEDIPFQLFENCRVVKGASRSIICDLQYNEYFLIPNALCEILLHFNGKTIATVKSFYNHDNDDIINEYFDFLLNKRLIFFSENLSYFSKLNLCWDYPGEISNAIIDINEVSSHDYSNIFSQLDELGCKNIQIRFFSPFAFSSIFQIIEATYGKAFIHIDLILHYEQSISNDSMQVLFEKFPAIHNIVVHSVKLNSGSLNSFINTNAIHWTSDEISSEKCCGIIDPYFFSINIETFTEALHFNTCLNKKIAIDVSGNIKNCPSIKESYGNIRGISMLAAINGKNKFDKYWNLKKDYIRVCKDCEFRYICTDCRAYVENPEDIYSKPLKCGYNPYTTEWKEWQSSLEKQYAIKSYQL